MSWLYERGVHEALKQYVFAMDRHSCLRCGRCIPDPIKNERGSAVTYLVAYHLKPLKAGGADVPENLVTLCNSCYQGVQSRGIDFTLPERCRGDVQICRAGRS